MDNNGPSRTALATAHARAYHQIADEPRILADPLAMPMLGASNKELAESEERGANDRPRRLFFAARSRCAEDRIASAADVRQVVILGAGLDTFGCRNNDPDLMVFEVDHPATQTWKRERFAAAGIDVPVTTTFVPADFETDTLTAQLESAGFSRAEPTVFVWLGVVYYLTQDAVDGTLDYIAGQSAAVDVIFDYLTPGDTGDERALMQERAAKVAALGEPWFSFFTPEGVAGQLRALGFGEIDDRSATDLIAGYLGDSAELAGDTPALQASRIVRASR